MGRGLGLQPGEVTLRRLVDYPLTDEPGELAMARDGAALEALARDRQPPFVLRAHGWSVPTLTAGKVQPLDARLLADAACAGVLVVRRPTGGGWLLHLPGDVSISYLEAGPVGSGGLRAAAARIGSAIARGLEAQGVQGRVQQPDGPGAAGRSDVCFARVDREEVAEEGVKVAGVAVGVRRRAVLAQTALPLATPRQSALADFAARWDPRRELAVERLRGVDGQRLIESVVVAVASAVGGDRAREDWPEAWERRARRRAGDHRADAGTARDSAAESV